MTDLVRLVTAWASATAALKITGALLSGLSASSWWSYAAVAAVTGAVGLVLRPVLVEVSARTWISAIVGTLISWATTAGTDDGLVTSLARRARRLKAVPDPEVEGILFVQMDGVPIFLLQPAAAMHHTGPASWESCAAPSTVSPRSGGTTVSSAGCWSPTDPPTPV